MTNDKTSNLDNLPDDALVVRCGLPPFEQPTNLLSRRRRHIVAGVYGLSVQLATGIAFDDLAVWCRNNQVGQTTVGEVRALGSDVVLTPGEGYHAILITPEDWQQEEAEILAKLFQPIRNPRPMTRQ